MNDITVWASDQLAANNLTAELGVELTESQLGAAAEHFARHRLDAYEWMAERVHSAILERLEKVSVASRKERRIEGWADGFNRAEETVVTMALEEIIGLAGRPPRSKGQVLRTMIRRARDRE